MQHYKLTELMLENDILDQGNTNMYEINKNFTTIIDEKRKLASGMDDKELDAEFNKLLLPENIDSGVTNMSRNDRESLISCYLALDDSIKNINSNKIIKVTCIIEMLKNMNPYREADPSCSLPVEKTLLRKIIHFVPGSAIYVWKNDCRSCDVVKSDLEELFGPSTDEILLLSICGPENAKFLYNNYRVIGAPTLLFMSYGNVVSRLQGSKYKSSIISEIDKLKQQTDRHV